MVSAKPRPAVQTRLIARAKFCHAPARPLRAHRICCEPSRARRPGRLVGRPQRLAGQHDREAMTARTATYRTSTVGAAATNAEDQGADRTQGSPAAICRVCPRPAQGLGRKRPPHEALCRATSPQTSWRDRGRAVERRADDERPRRATTTAGTPTVASSGESSGLPCNASPPQCASNGTHPWASSKVALPRTKQVWPSRPVRLPIA